MFSDNSMVENEDGSVTITFDLNEETISILENVLRCNSDSEDFQARFQSFAHKAIETYIASRPVDGL